MAGVVLDYEFIDAELPKGVVSRSTRLSLPRKDSLDYSWRVQNTGYWCGPTAAQMILLAKGISESQQTLANKLGTDSDGTDYVGLFPPVLNSYLKDAKFVANYGIGAEALWTAVVKSIDAGYGVVANIVAYTHNHPPGYPDYTVWHYVPIFGYDGAGSSRRIFCADSANFSGVKSWWVPLKQMASLVAPKGVAPATAGRSNFLGLSTAQLAVVSNNFAQLGPT